jgi:hypothetical protein
MFLLLQEIGDDCSDFAGLLPEREGAGVFKDFGLAVGD